MTDKLKTLMDRATDRTVPFVPDAAVLVGTARRRARRRRVIGAGATMALLLVAGGGTTVARSVLVQRTDPAAKSTTRAEDRYTVCVYSHGRRVRDAQMRTWPVVAAASDQYGAAELRQPPGSFEIAFCQRAPRQVPVPGPHQGGLFLTVVRSADDQRQVVSVAGQASYLGVSVRISVATSTDAEVEPAIRNGWFVHRYAEPVGTVSRLVIRYYSRDGVVLQTLRVR